MTTTEAKQPTTATLDRDNSAGAAATPAQDAHSLPTKERKQQCYCCGHANPAAAWECEKCYVRL